jgi:hypothetical protein
MTFTEVFGGTTIYPSGVSYRAVALSANQTLAWPVETATNANIVAQIMDVTPSIAALSILMPPANEASVGETTLFFNAGSFAFTVKDNGGNTIVSIAPGLSYQVYLIGNATVNGTWRSTQYAAGTSSATAGSLVGAGIKAINTTLNQSMAVTSLNSNYTIGNADRSEAFLWSGGAGTLTLPSALAVGNDWFCHVRNSGTGAISLATTGGQLINGAPSLAFNPGDSAIVICDGSGFFTIGFGQSASFAFDYVSIDLTSQTSPYTLAGANLNRIAYSFGGTLTANMTIHIPATFQQYWLANETLGGFSITVKVAGQTGVIIGNGVRAICYCNGTDLVDADTSSFSFPVSISQGGTGATNESGARVNLGGTSTGIAVFTAANAASARSSLSAAASGANSDITSLSGLTTPLSIGQGGTGSSVALTQGSVVFAGVGGAYSQDNANFFWDDTNNRLGIGTTTPASSLNILGDQVLAGATGTATLGLQLKGPAISAVPSAQVQGYIATGDSSIGVAGDLLIAPRTDATANVRFITGTSPAERMRITAAGDVGIATVSPSSRLHVSGNFVRIDQAGSNAAYLGNAAELVTGAPAGAGLRFDGTALRIAASSTEIAQFTSSGNFGIGVVPTAKLHVAGTIQSSSGSTTAQMYADGSAAYFTSVGAFPSIFLTNATERMRITSTGLVGIGATPSVARLEVNGNIRTTVGSGGTLTLHETDPTRANQLVFGADASGSYVNASFATGGSGVLRFQTANTEQMRINAAGDVGIGTTSPSAKLDVNGSLRANSLTLTTALAVAQGGTGATTDSGARTNLGATTVGGNLFTLTNPSAITFPRFNADNTVSALDAATFRSAIGAGTSSTTGTVTSVGGTGSVNGITLSGTVTSSGSLTLGGTLSGVSLTTQVSGTLPVANGGTGQTSYTDGQLLIGNTATGALSKATITAGSGISVTNGNGTITIASSAGGGTVTSVGMTVPTFLSVTPSTITSSGTFAVSLSGTALPIANGGTGSTSTAYCSLTTNVSGTLPVANGGTGQTSYTDGQLLIGNSGTGGLSKATITAGSGISITNGNGSISIAATGGGGTVTSVGLTLPAFLSVTPSTITSSGTFAVSLSGTALPISNGGTGSTSTAYCSLTTNVTGTLPIANGGTGATSAGTALTALGAYPATNPNGYTNNTGTVTSVGGTGSANGLSLSGTVTTSGNLTLSGSVTSVATTATIDGVTIGYRSIPRSTTSGTAAVGDVGKCIAVSAGITIPNATFAAGDAISIYNDSASAVTITQGASLTLRQAGTTNTGNRTLAARGMATVWFNSSSEAIISGAGVS